MRRSPGILYNRHLGNFRSCLLSPLPISINQRMDAPFQTPVHLPWPDSVVKESSPGGSSIPMRLASLQLALAISCNYTQMQVDDVHD
jgi:hypothetical protein